MELPKEVPRPSPLEQVWTLTPSPLEQIRWAYQEALRSPQPWKKQRETARPGTMGEALWIAELARAKVHIPLPLLPLRPSCKTSTTRLKSILLKHEKV